ncbi:MAG: M50 family metallopeptidase [Myxococcota bacterium]
MIDRRTIKAALREEEHDRIKRAFWIAAGITLLLSVVQPWGRLALYPFALLATWAHELGHGTVGLLAGGHFDHLELYSSLGGVAHVSRPEWASPLVSMGGLLGPAFAGAAFIILGVRERTATLSLACLTVAMAVSTALLVRPFTSFGFIAMAVLTVSVAAFTWRADTFWRSAACQFLGIQFCLGSLSDFDYMFTASFERDGEIRISDSAKIAEHWGMTYWFWGALIAVASVAILLTAYKLAWRRQSTTCNWNAPAR